MTSIVPGGIGVRSSGGTATITGKLRARDCPGEAGLPIVASILPDIVVGVANAATSIAGSTGFGPNRTECFRYYGCNATPNGGGYYESNFANISLNSNSGAGAWTIEFRSDAPRLEIFTQGKGANFRVMADGAYLSYSPVSGPPSDGNGYRVLVDWTAVLPTFLQRQLRHYRIEASGNFSFGGIAALASDTIAKVPYKGQRLMCFGDSFTEPTINDTGITVTRNFADAGTTNGSPTLTSAALAAFTQYDRYAAITGTGIPANTRIKSVQSATSVTLNNNATATATVTGTIVIPNTGHEGYPGLLAKMLGCPDVWFQGSGGTGYVNVGSGGRVAFPTRFTHDVINYAADILFIAGGINDGSRSPTVTAAMVTSALTGMLSSLKSGLPNCDTTVLSPFLGHMGTNLQPGGAADNNLTIRNAIKSAADAATVRFIDVIESGVTGQATSSTADFNAGASTVTVIDALPNQAMIRVGAPTNSWTTRVTSAASGGTPFTQSISPNNSSGGTIVSGSPVAVVGPAFINGTGVQGSPVGDGNSDFFVSSDNTHPTQAGHLNIAMFIYQLYVATLPV